MHIFIDEAGSFVFADAEKNPWSVVVAYAISDNKINKLQSLVNELKRNLNISGEIKISDFTKENYVLYLDFIKKIADLNGVLFASIISTLKYNEKTYKEILDFDKVNTEENPFQKHTHLQLYLQQRIQFDLINTSIIGSKCYFSKTNPSELSNIIWEADKKGELFEGFHSKYIDRYLSGEGHNFSYIFMKSPEHNFNKFYEAYSMSLDGSSGFSATKILKNFKFEDSKSSLGIQVADLLSSGIRRCLKGVWDDYETDISKSIAKLLISHPKMLQIIGNNSIAKKHRKELFPITRSSVQRDDLSHPSLEIFKCYARNFEEIESGEI